MLTLELGQIKSIVCLVLHAADDAKTVGRFSGVLL